jgi:hypothetical protein
LSPLYNRPVAGELPLPINQHREANMARKLSPRDIQNLGFKWPRYALIEEYCVTEEGKIDLGKTLESIESSRAFYRKQLRDAYAFKTKTGADYSDFTDRFDDYARMERELGAAISYLDQVIKAAEGPAGTPNNR